MTEAIAFLFAYSGPRYVAKVGGDVPSVEEFLDYVRDLSLQTYHCVVAPGVRRRISNRLLGALEGGRRFEIYAGFLEWLEPVVGERGLCATLLQAQNIGLRALTIYNAFVVDSSDDFLRSHVAEPFVWYSRTLYHECLGFHTRGLGLCLSFVQEGVAYLESHVETKNSISAFFSAYGEFSMRAVPYNKAWGKVLGLLLVGACRSE
jgi:hypothetical protein